MNKKLTRQVKIAMLHTLKAGEMDDENNKVIGDFVGREPLEIRFVGSKEDAEAIWNEVPYPSEKR